jgi:hypothetical protein
MRHENFFLQQFVVCPVVTLRRASVDKNLIAKSLSACYISTAVVPGGDGRRVRRFSYKHK